MSYQIDRLDGDRIIVISFASDFDVMTEFPATSRDLLAVFESLVQAAVLINDARGVRFDLDGNPYH